MGHLWVPLPVPHLSAIHIAVHDNSYSYLANYLHAHFEIIDWQDRVWHVIKNIPGHLCGIHFLNNGVVQRFEKKMTKDVPIL